MRGRLSDKPDLLDEATLRERLPSRSAGDIARLLQHWNELAGEHTPQRSSIDPLNMPPQLLPILAIMEYAPEANDWRYALVGERIREMIGSSVKGRMLGDVLAKSDDARRVRALYDETVKLRRPTISFGQHTVGFATRRDFARILFPYANGDGEISTLLLLLTYL